MNQVSDSVKIPKTARGRKTRDKLLRAAEIEFGEKGYHDAAIAGITQRAGVALGSFYNYFDGKEEIFAALVSYMNHRIRRWLAERVADAPDRITAERLGFEAYIEFVREHRGIYRIVQDAEFIANDAFRAHYESLSAAYEANLREAGEKGDIRDGDYEIWAWSLLGMALFLGMRYAEWEEDESPSQVAEVIADLIANGIRKKNDAQ
jgi:AcrR family transcriptional regulator